MPDKSLGQHWLKDRQSLRAISQCAQLEKNDTVLEIGPGLGTLTSELLRSAKKVVAVEFDPILARKLPPQFPGGNLEVVSGDILHFNLSALPAGYKVVANIPYYITSKIVRLLMTAANKPSLAVLLVQKEVAERLAVTPGKLSILGVSAQVYAEVSLGPVIGAELFTPPPKVDSQVVILKAYSHPTISRSQEKDFFRTVKAGFSSKRKKLRSSLSGGLQIPKQQMETILLGAGVNPDDRAEDLSLDDWKRITEKIHDKA